SWLLRETAAATAASSGCAGKTARPAAAVATAASLGPPVTAAGLDVVDGSWPETSAATTSASTISPMAMYSVRRAPDPITCGARRTLVVISSPPVGGLSNQGRPGRLRGAGRALDGSPSRRQATVKPGR